LSLQGYFTQVAAHSSQLFWFAQYATRGRAHVRRAQTIRSHAACRPRKCVSVAWLVRASCNALSTAIFGSSCMRRSRNPWSRRLFGEFARASSPQEGNAASTKARLHGVAPPWYLLMGSCAEHSCAFDRSLRRLGDHMWAPITALGGRPKPGASWGPCLSSCDASQRRGTCSCRPNMVDLLRKMIIWA